MAETLLFASIITLSVLTIRSYKEMKYEADLDRERAKEKYSLEDFIGEVGTGEIEL